MNGPAQQCRQWVSPAHPATAPVATYKNTSPALGLQADPPLTVVPGKKRGRAWDQGNDASVQQLKLDACAVHLQDIQFFFSYQKPEDEGNHVPVDARPRGCKATQTRVCTASKALHQPQTRTRTTTVSGVQYNTTLLLNLTTCVSFHQMLDDALKIRIT
jgi:hypothetical protein